MFRTDKGMRTEVRIDDSFVFRSLDTIGYPDALEDEEFLQDSFVDNGYLEVLRNCKRPERIVLGRTGSGKSALLEQLMREETEEHARRFMPETLSLNYVSNSTILSALEAIGVNLDLFFSLLWKHVFAVELIRWRYNITDAKTQSNAIQNFATRFKPTERRALEYLEHYGDKFWIDSDDRVVAFTKKFEDEIKGKVSLSKLIPGVGAAVESSSKITEEEKREIRDRAQAIVNEVQVRALADIVSLVKVVLNDPGRRWYIVIDKLDENWVDDRFKAQLIRALLDTVRSFREIQNLKIVVGLRYDLIDRVFKAARGSGAQREKYEGVFLHMRWSQKSLATLLDRRINHLVRSRYSRSVSVNFRDVFPREIVKKQPTLDWLIERSQLRPRDAIAYVNICIKNSDGRATITAETVRAAEGEYSRGRLEALFAEWEIDYPNLPVFVEILKNRPSHFRVDDIDDFALLQLADKTLLGAESSLNKTDDPLSIALRVFNLEVVAAPFRKTIASVFYQTGIVGIKLSRQRRYMFANEGEEAISKSEIAEESRVTIHPCYWRVLGIDREPASLSSRI